MNGKTSFPYIHRRIDNGIWKRCKTSRGQEWRGSDELRDSRDFFDAADTSTHLTALYRDKSD